MNLLQQQTLALAGMVQAVCQVEDIASRGMTDRDATAASIGCTLQLQPRTFTEAIGPVASLRYGLQNLVDLFQGEQKYVPALQYAITLMQLEKNLRKSRAVQRALAEELELVLRGMRDASANGSNKTSLQTEYTDEIISQLADVWTEQVRKLEPQVVVQGKPLYLQNENNVRLIRALLLAGLRCSWLWRQLGGRRWHLLLRRKRLLETARSLLQA